YVPRNQSGTLEVEVDDKSVVPQTSPRVWSGHDWNAGWKSWLLRNKAVQSERVPRRNFQNNIYRVFPQSQYAKTNPEYYPLVNGKRWFPASDSYRYWWPSMGHKDVQRITVEYMRKWFDDNPHRDSFALGMDDIAY